MLRPLSFKTPIQVDINTTAPDGTRVRTISRTWYYRPLKIEDHSKNDDLRARILAYSDFLTDYISRHDYKYFLHSRCYF